jgi:hypothetical protein
MTSTPLCIPNTLSEWALQDPRPGAAGPPGPNYAVQPHIRSGFTQTDLSQQIPQDLLSTGASQRHERSRLCVILPVTGSPLTLTSYDRPNILSPVNS